MTNKFYFFRSFAPENGSGMDRLCIGNGSAKSRKLFAVLFCLLFVGVGQMWGVTINFNNSQLPTGWSGTGTFDSNNNHYHTSAPGYALNNKNLVTCEYTNITALSFYGSTSTGGDGKSLTIEYKEHGSSSWTSLASIKLAKGAQANKTVTVTSIANKTVALRFSTTWATAYIDDIEITTSSGGSTACATPTFSPVAGSYIGTQSVTISSTTTGSTIYYTTNGSTPTTSSSHGTAGAASATVSVSSSQTLKAIAVKDGSTNSEVGTAAYTIVSCDDDNFEWNLATNSYTTGTNEVTWSGTYATMHNEGTNATNYLGGDANSRTSSRFYSGNTLTITPASGTTISHVVFTATTETYATTLGSSTWTNASASASGTTVIVTPTDGTSAFSASVGGTCGFTNVNVCYSACESLGQINGSFFRYHFLANFGVFWARVKMYPKLYSVTAIRSPYFS